MNATCWKTKNMWQYQRRKPKERVCVCWGSLVRRHIKATQLIDEAFYKWRVKVCLSLFICLFFFFFFLNCCLSLTSPCFPLLCLSCCGLFPQVAPHSWTGGNAVATAPQSHSLPYWGQQSLCSSKPWWYLPLWDPPKRLNCILFQSGSDLGSSQSWSYKRGVETQSQTAGAWPPEDFGTKAG